MMEFINWVTRYVEGFTALVLGVAFLGAAIVLLVERWRG